MKGNNLKGRLGLTREMLSSSHDVLKNAINLTVKWKKKCENSTFKLKLMRNEWSEQLTGALLFKESRKKVPLTEP